jgi:hypothetical protein
VREHLVELGDKLGDLAVGNELEPSELIVECLTCRRLSLSERARLLAGRGAEMPDSSLRVG